MHHNIHGWTFWSPSPLKVQPIQDTLSSDCTYYRTVIPFEGRYSFSVYLFLNPRSGIFASGTANQHLSTCDCCSKPTQASFGLQFLQFKMLWNAGSKLGPRPKGSQTTTESSTLAPPPLGWLGRLHRLPSSSAAGVPTGIPISCPSGNNKGSKSMPQAKFHATME